jgi:hypothetical protein
MAMAVRFVGASGPSVNVVALAVFENAESPELFVANARTHLGSQPAVDRSQPGVRVGGDDVRILPSSSSSRTATPH